MTVVWHRLWCNTRMCVGGPHAVVTRDTKMMRLAALVGLLLLILPVAICHAQFSSTFDTNNENWRYSTMGSPFNTGSGPAYPGTVAAAPFLGLLGNPAGSIGWSESEPGGYQYFLTPVA